MGIRLFFCRWLYLEPILSNDDGELGIKFRKVDQGFRQVARAIENDARLSALTQSVSLQPMLDSISEQLSACQSALKLYIDEKRSTFPRLYFLSDDDLLELLGQARAGAEGREAVMQSHLKKLFPGITGVRLGPDGMSITALCSQHGETLLLEHPVDIDCTVEARAGAEGREAVMQSHLKKLSPGITGVRLGPDGMSITALCSQHGETLPLEHPVDIDCTVEARAGAEGREAVMQSHLKKLFPGITGVRLGPDGMSITALCSQHGETLPLEHPVDIDCTVENWLKNLETEMRSSIKNMALKCVVTNSLQEQDPFSLPTQIICLAQNIRFTEQTERALAAKELHKLKANIEKENLYYAESEVEDENERNKRQALILQCAYYLAVIKTLIENNVTSTSHWLWQKQLRFYLLSNKEIVAKMGLAQISYSYEYLGVNTGQFVRTELADECFLILTQALHLGLVGNPFGPAGTGKTESVKALGGLVGRLVLVFNCDEAMDAQSMGRLLTGLALCGAWGCFDELNRLTADTLAAVSHQFAALLDKSGNGRAVLGDREVTVSEWCGLAATMNPVGRGYGGRRLLPAALERVLRPVAMMSPEPTELAAHLLAAKAVANAGSLAAHLCRVFAMASELLSGQRHYDWGLRALKAAVGSCGNALSGKGVSKEPLAQKAALRRVLRLNNLSKLTKDDADRFEAILGMVFADVPEEETSANPISTALEATVKSLNLMYNDLQTLTQQGKTIVEHIICQKAMSRASLLGRVDLDTRQWTDGVISATALEVAGQADEPSPNATRRFSTASLLTRVSRIAHALQKRCQRATNALKRRDFTNANARPCPS
ncbi:hypothetical protein JYU34_009488 [Plutella xylostella]|uniref:Cytoplasmic dynein 2 heavy chain 1 n=1 Tax=Plutella xylostella TaxID=51655 RepID=A0ABQ7QJL4_PLUXY|nr:hypothetical protein JYU34_009488 [Plutella xylostella]